MANEDPQRSDKIQNVISEAILVVIGQRDLFGAVRGCIFADVLNQLVGDKIDVVVKRKKILRVVGWAFFAAASSSL